MQRPSLHAPLLLATAFACAPGCTNRVVTGPAGPDAGTISDAAAPDAALDRDADSPRDAAAPDDAALVRDAGSARDAGPPPAPPGDVHVVITADNAYSFAYGDATRIDTFVRGARASLAGEIFNCPVGLGPEAYTVPTAAAPSGAYLYIISWDDLSVTQGVLGEFERDGRFVYTGDERFEVCATGIDHSRAAPGIDPINGPTKESVEAEIARCNEGLGAAGTTSEGWVDLAGAVTAGAMGTLAVGEANDAAPGGEFPPVCSEDPTMGGLGIDAAARWMWYAPEGLSGSPFRSTGSNTFRSYLIFRLPADEINLI